MFSVYAGSDSSDRSPCLIKYSLNKWFLIRVKTLILCLQASIWLLVNCGVKHKVLSNTSIWHQANMILYTSYYSLFVNIAEFQVKHI